MCQSPRQLFYSVSINRCVHLQACLISSCNAASSSTKAEKPSTSNAWKSWPSMPLLLPKTATTLSIVFPSRLFCNSGIFLRRTCSSALESDSADGGLTEQIFFFTSVHTISLTQSENKCICAYVHMWQPKWNKILTNWIGSELRVVYCHTRYKRRSHHDLGTAFGSLRSSMGTNIGK